jgi:hypothetical protein
MLSIERPSERIGWTRLPPRLVPHAPHPHLVPRAAHCSRLALHCPRLALRFAAPCASRLDSRYAQPRSDLRTVASSSVAASSSASTIVHWRQQVDEHMLQPYVSCVLDVCSYVSSRCCKIRSGIICFICFSYFKRML